MPVRVQIDHGPGRGGIGPLGFVGYTLVVLARAVWVLVVAAWRYPAPAVLLGVLTVVGLVWGVEGLAVATTSLVVAVGVWQWRRPVSFARLITRPAWRRRTARLLRQRWVGWCERVGLVVTDVDRINGGRTWFTPALTKVKWADKHHQVLTARVELLAGQTVDDLAGVTDKLAAAAGARTCQVAAVAGTVATMSLSWGDPLAYDVPAFEPHAIPNLAAIPVGRTESGDYWTLKVAGTHLLIAGVTGAGKGSVLWSILAGIAGGIRSGHVQVWAVDGKAGMELSVGAGLFTRFATTVEDGVQLLEDAADLMTARAARMAGTARVHTPTTDEPLVVVVVDEVALLTAYHPDRKTTARAEKALAVLATQGRAPGVVLIAALQDPRKEVLGLRNLFPTRVGMRLDEATQVDMVLGEGARAAGALCHKMSESIPGAAYVKVDGRREPQRVRASYWSDELLTHLATDYAPPTTGTTSAVEGDGTIPELRDGGTQ